MLEENDNAEVSISLTKGFRTIKLEVQPGDVKDYQIREMDGKQRDAYLNANKAKHKDVGGGKLQVADFKGLYSLLLSHCLYDELGKLVTEAVIQTYPSGAQQQLHDVANKVNKLERAGAAAALYAIGIALTEYKLEPDVALGIIRDIHKNWAEQVPGSKGDGEGEGEN